MEVEGGVPKLRRGGSFIFNPLNELPPSFLVMVYGFKGKYRKINRKSG